MKEFPGVNSSNEKLTALTGFHHRRTVAVPKNGQCCVSYRLSQFIKDCSADAVKVDVCDAQQSSTLAIMFFDHRACVPVLS